MFFKNKRLMPYSLTQQYTLVISCKIKEMQLISVVIAVSFWFFRIIAVFN